MAFDATYLAAVLAELREKAADARVDKIHQPSRDTVILHLKSSFSRPSRHFKWRITVSRLG